jgi:hypothetical protein
VLDFESDNNEEEEEEEEKLSYASEMNSFSDELS